MKKLIAAISLIALVLSLPVTVFSAEYAEDIPAEAKIGLSAECAILTDADSGRVLFEKNADKRMGMASTTKLMTALVALQISDKNRVIAIPKEAVGVEGSSVYLVEGERLTLAELLRALLLSSANDAATAIAIALSGSVEAFAEKMNETAEGLGLIDTHFTNPHGLYDDEHYTTARELAIISAEALKNELIAEIVAEKKATVPHDGEADKRLLVNHNKLLRSYKGAIGMKTGFTKKTGRCLVSAARRDGLTLIAVTLNAPDDWNDHHSLLDYGFDNFERKIFYTAGAFSYALPLSDGEGETVTLTNLEPLVLTVKKDSSAASFKVEATFRFAVGEVRRGDTFGCVTLSADGHSVTSPLAFTESSVGKTKHRKGFFERIFTFFSPDE